MDYQTIYNKIIKNSKDRENNQYVERHHIIPKCLNGNDSKENITCLTYREHFICHWLLCKIYPNEPKLKAAFAKMLQSTKNHKRIVSSYMFEAVKRATKDLHYPWLQGKEPWNKGKKGLQEAWNKGLKQPATEERKIKTSETLKKKYEEIGHHRKGTPSWNSGKKGLQEAWNKNKSMPKLPCPHCNILVDSLNMKRWHGDNCKSLGDRRQ